MSAPGWRIELLPSKGLSVSGASFGSRSLFWDPPVHSLPNPATVDLHGDVHIEGKAEPGMAFMRTFCGGVEMMGLRNWGLPRRDPKTGELLPLHGEVSNIPVDRVTVRICRAGVHARARFDVPAFSGGRRSGPWYKRGSPAYRVEKNVSLDERNKRISIVDVITNVARRRQRPDWGYHIQLFPKDGARFLVPGLRIVNWTGEACPTGYDTWRPSSSEETVYMGLHARPDRLVTRNGVETLLLYPDGTGIRATVPRTPFFLAWFSAGGRRSPDYLVESNGRLVPMFDANCDGVGPEIGTSALDQGERYDPDVPVRELEPGESLLVHIDIELLSKHEAGRARDRILKYCVAV
jgi:hypothetical protein